MSFDSGNVCIRLKCDEAGRIVGAAVTSERPRVSAAFWGKPVSQMLALMPLVFAVCGQAQGVAARAAVAAAQGQALAPFIDSAVAAEAAREHLMHLLAGADRALLAMVLQGTRVPGDEARRIAADLLGVEVETWLDRHLGNALDNWMQSQSVLAIACRGIPDVVPEGWQSRALPSLSALETLALWPRLDREVALMPTFQGSPAETGAWARRRAQASALDTDGPFRVRWLARLREWLEWCCESPTCLPGRISAECLAPGVGRSAVETARGLLLHEISVADETVTDLVIVAPTEWNFHPRGVLASWLQGDVAPALVEAAIRALDPCVPAKVVRES